MTLLGILPLLIALAGSAAENPALAVPRGRAVMIDGEIAPAEWAKAGRLALGPSLTLYAQQTEDYVYLAVQPEKAAFLAVDLYLQPANGPEINLHASAKLGERLRDGGKWPAWKWWNHHGWTANFARATSFDKREFLPDAAREFQITKERFGPGPWKVRIELEGAAGTTAYPSAGAFVQLDL